MNHIDNIKVHLFIHNMYYMYRTASAQNTSKNETKLQKCEKYENDHNNNNNKSNNSNSTFEQSQKYFENLKTFHRIQLFVGIVLIIPGTFILYIYAVVHLCIIQSRMTHDKVTNCKFLPKPQRNPFL